MTTDYRPAWSTSRNLAERPKVLYYLRCTVDQQTYVSYSASARCPFCSAPGKVYGVKEIGSPTPLDQDS